jgi:heme/copper-type cytochrome/quinol oxidase subunit 3
MIDFLILNWTAGLLSGFVLLLGTFFVSSAIDKLVGSLKAAVILVVISTFLFAVLSFLMSIGRLMSLSQASASAYLWEPYTFLFAAVFFTLGAMRLHYELKSSEDFVWGKKKLLNAIKESSGKKLKYDFK